ncbi:hypothetical protein M0813_12188 [Anaeramoeba flamelloides]|uniref:Uncharacterized protein n=1 Tax=Anaeramoeba flamelloides TaxID=1746091 RepID=A0ABQ8ZCG8_9EUKA|nr:hypothetical protein M0813_12188 [Anaeramoeba flamelloides]
MEFDNIETEVDYQPIVLVDFSGSTRAMMGNRQTVLHTEIDKLYQKLAKHKVEEIHLMFWSNKVQNLGTFLVSDLKKIKVVEKSKKINCFTYKSPDSKQRQTSTIFGSKRKFNSNQKESKNVKSDRNKNSQTLFQNNNQFDLFSSTKPTQNLFGGQKETINTKTITTNSKQENNSNQKQITSLFSKINIGTQSKTNTTSKPLFSKSTTRTKAKESIFQKKPRFSDGFSKKETPQKKPQFDLLVNSKEKKSQEKSDDDAIYINPNGLTFLNSALEQIPNEWCKDKKICDLYIVTDGELSGRIQKTSELLKKLIEEYGIRIFILTVETNRINYREGNVTSGRRIYKMVRENGLTKNVKEFVSYNNYHKAQAFINFINPDLPRGYIPFRNENFKIEKLHLFIKHIESLIQNTKDSFGMIKLAHELSISIYNINKHKAEHLQFGTIEIFCRLFEGSVHYGEIREMFLKEIKNHMDGKSSTFTDYKLNREMVFEKAQVSLFKNVKASLNGKYKNFYISFPIDVKVNKGIQKDNKNENEKEKEKENEKENENKKEKQKKNENEKEKENKNENENEKEKEKEEKENIRPSTQKHIFKYKAKKVKESIKFYEKSFKNGGVKFNDISMPVFPIDIFMDGGFGDQCIRQWIRMNYCKKYGFKIASDYILYYFLVQAVKVVLSDNIEKSIQRAYKTLMKIMLGRKKYGLDITEYNYLENNNHPSSSNGNTKKITYFLSQAAKSEGIDVKPYTLWYCISTIAGLEKSQFKFCKEDLLSDGYEIKWKIEKETIYNLIKSKYRHCQETDLTHEFHYEYMCYITLDDTSETGGYVIPRHDISSTVKCAPNFVLSEEGLESYQGREFMCPICYKKLEISSLTKIKPQKEVLKEMEEKQGLQDQSITLDEPKYNSNSHKKIDVAKLYENCNDYELKLMDECNLEALSYEFDKPTICDPLQNHRPLVFTQEEFNKNVFKRFPFLQGLNYRGVCLAGGFCRSIILKSQMKDLDFFFYGEKEDHYKNFLRFYQDLINNINQYERGKGTENTKKTNITFLLMYKPQFNVFELVGIVDPNKFLHEEYVLDNFSNYKFTSLRKYNKYVYIDPLNRKVYRKRRHRGYQERDIEEDYEFYTHTSNETQPWLKKIESKSTQNYFEDRDITGLRIKYRIQFILVNFDSIGDIFDSFDMNPSKVAFDGEHTYFTRDSELAFRYMMNIVDQRRYSDLFDTRLNKYLSYGFSIVMPHLDISLLKMHFSYNSFKNLVPLAINKFKFSVSSIDGNTIMINHNSNIKDKLDYIKELQENAKKEDVVLYKSTMYCSLVSLLRYVKINKIPYLFCNVAKLPDKDQIIQFKEEKTKVSFKDALNTRIHDFNWYGIYKKKN